MGNSCAKSVVGNKKPLSETKQCCNSSEHKAVLRTSISNKLKSFSLNDLKKATKNFRQENLLGEGRDGLVFKGWIDKTTYAPTKPGSGMVVAIKNLKPESFEGEWLEEVNYLEQLPHENLVKVIGYCLEEGGEPIAWTTRVNIAIGVAKGIAFLHSLKENVLVIDLRTTSILLDSDFNAKLSGFCLVRYDLRRQAFKFLTRHAGYYGAEECVTAAAGRRAIEFDTSREMQVDSVKPLLSDRGMVLRIMDARLGDQYSKEGAQAAAALALQCLSRSPKSRPPIVDVLAALEGLHSLDTIPRTPRFEAESRATKHCAH
ncbi:probable serine/threonine-protein kinase PBL2 isoform X2 [Lotus japonicus]|uniref:probable serine/threonine-protein kinase PBL2 isoform X2 n=1 Tax=Lotus japonicus TaxID=34305 RepID=UPI00258E9041|nr:probable serine/threonine-protein kinase PBL2 isoform X2 [Lotus japonicus]